MVLKSYAKLNLSLSVNKKLKNGLHNIQSIYCLIDIYDKIFIKKSKNKNSDQIVFTGPFSKDVNESNNSVKKVLDLMRKNKLIHDYYSVKVIKKIPVFAGFGGGTSNAASILKYLVKKKYNKKIFDKIVNEVGSDLRLFSHSLGYQKNLKFVIPMKKKYKLYFLLVFPKIKSSTKSVYSKIKKFSKLKFFLKKNLYSREDFISSLINLKNDLQSIVEKRHPIINRLLIDISVDNTCLFSRMTGSGSALYGMFVNKKCSIVALKKLRKKYPKYWFSIAKTI